MKNLCGTIFSLMLAGCGNVGPVGGVGTVLRSDAYGTETGMVLSIGTREQGNNATINTYSKEQVHDAFPRFDFVVEFFPRGKEEVRFIQEGKSYSYGGRTIKATSNQTIEGFSFRTILGARYTLLGRQSTSYAQRLDVGVFVDWESVLVTQNLEWRVDQNEILEIGSPAFNDNNLRLGALLGWNLRYSFINFRVDTGASYVASTDRGSDREIGDIGAYTGLSIMLGY